MRTRRQLPDRPSTRSRTRFDKLWTTSGEAAPRFDSRAQNQCFQRFAAEFPANRHGRGGRRVPLHGVRGLPRAGEPAWPGTAVPGAESMISEACSEILRASFRVAHRPPRVSQDVKQPCGRADLRAPNRNIIGDISVFRKTFLAALVSQFEIPAWADCVETPVKCPFVEKWLDRGASLDRPQMSAQRRQEAHWLAPDVRGRGAPSQKFRTCVNGLYNCDRNENRGFSTQSAESRRWPNGRKRRGSRRSRLPPEGLTFRPGMRREKH